MTFVFVPKSRSPIPKVTLGTGFQSVKSTFVFRSEKVRVIRVKQQWMRKDYEKFRKNQSSKGK